jgi:hypothetical protein
MLNEAQLAQDDQDQNKYSQEMVRAVPVLLHYFPTFNSWRHWTFNIVNLLLNNT